MIAARMTHILTTHRFVGVEQLSKGNNNDRG